jgi:hypothetical protein
MIWVVHSGPRGQKGTGSRIRIRNTGQNLLNKLLWYLVTVVRYEFHVAYSSF